MDQKVGRTDQNVGRIDQKVGWINLGRIDQNWQKVGRIDQGRIDLVGRTDLGQIGTGPNWLEAVSTDTTLHSTLQSTDYTRVHTSSYTTLHCTTLYSLHTTYTTVYVTLHYSLTVGPAPQTQYIAGTGYSLH